MMDTIFGVLWFVWLAAYIGLDYIERNGGISDFAAMVTMYFDIKRQG